MPTTELPALALSPDFARYSEAQLRFAGSAWPMRAAEELRSALVFRALARAARAAGMPDPWPGRFDAAVRDELHHARLCARVGARIGAPEPVYDARPVRKRLAFLPDPRMRAAALLLVEVAIGETISTYLFRAGRRAATEPLTRGTLSAILVDEVRHQRLGWTGLLALLPALPDSLREAVQCEAARGLAQCEQATALPAMRWLESRRAFDPACTALGVLHPEARVEAFYLAVERLVVPRLTRVGLDGSRAWERRYKQGTGRSARAVDLRRSPIRCMLSDRCEDPAGQVYSPLRPTAAAICPDGEVLASTGASVVDSGNHGCRRSHCKSLDARKKARRRWIW